MFTKKINAVYSVRGVGMGTGMLTRVSGADQIRTRLIESVCKQLRCPRG